MTFTTSEKVIKKIVLAGNTVGGFTANVGSFNAGTWEGASTSVVLTATGTEKINTITVTYGDASGKTATTINFAEGYKTKIGRGPDEMFPELGSFVALPTATVKAGDAVVSSEVEWTLDLTSWDGKEGEAQPSINDGKINNLNNGSGLITVKASYAGSETYEASTKSYDLKVYSPYGLLSEMVGDIFDPTFEKDDMNDKDGKPVFYFFRNIDAAGIPVVTNTVTFVSGNYIYLTDGTANLLFYGNNSQNLKKGDVISGNVSDTNLGGFWGNLKRYNKLPEFAFTDMNVKVESEGATVTPKTIKIDELAANINNYVKVENAEFVSASGKNLTFKVGETTLAVYNQFSVDATTLEATAMYTIEAMGSVYKKNKDTDAVYQLYPISFTKQGGGSDPTPSGDFYAWEDGMEAANKLTFADGSTVQITGNESKTIGSAKKITIDGNEYTTLKISNGAENTFTLPAGKKAKNVTFYSYVNKATAEAADRDNYWADVNGTAYDAAAKGTMKDFTDSEDYLLHPDVYTFELGGVNSFTFKNAGYQPCIVIRVALDDPANISTVKTAVIDGTRYNLAGQKVDKSYKGVVIMNGKKMIQK